MPRKPRIRSANSPKEAVKVGRTSATRHTRHLALEVRHELGDDVVDVHQFDDPGRV